MGFDYNQRKEYIAMEIIKIIGIGLAALIIIVLLKQYKPEYALYVSLIAGALIISLVIGKIAGIIDILKSLANKSVINNEFLILLIKITGIAILTEYAVSVCKDTGESAIASKVDFGGKILIMSMSIPIMSSLLETIIKILP